MVRWKPTDISVKPEIITVVHGEIAKQPVSQPGKSCLTAALDSNLGLQGFDRNVLL